MIPGCLFFNTNDDEPIVIEDDLTPYDFDLDITTVKITISVEYEVIGLVLVLTNNDNIDIKLETYQIEFPHLELIHPDGSTYIIFYGNISIAPIYQVIKSGSSITSELDLKSYDYWDEMYSSPRAIDWNMKGSYACQATAYGIESNLWEFELI
jgi:hypothetical protein